MVEKKNGLGFWGRVWYTGPEHDKVQEEIKMLFLNKRDIEKTVDLNEMMDTIEEAYRIYGSGKYYMPPRPSVEYKSKTLLYMPCFVEDAFGTKILTVFPDNADLGLPAIDGLMLMNDYETGKPLAMLDGQTVTAYRTGAVGGVGIRHLSRKDCHTVGIVGAGVQGFYQALYACAARDIKNVYIYTHSGRNLTEYIERLKKAVADPCVEIEQVPNVEELVKKSEIICTATTASAPVLPDDKELLKGKCIIAIGSYKPDMREIPDAIFELVDAVYTELPYACEESGDLSQPLESGLLSMDKVKFMDEYLASHEDEDKIASGTTYFKSVGMGLFDVCAARKLVQDAMAKGIGQSIEM